MCYKSYGMFIISMLKSSMLNLFFPSHSCLQFTLDIQGDLDINYMLTEFGCI